MIVRELKTAQELDHWKHWVNEQPDATLWQSPEWKTYQEALGRDVRVYLAEEQESIMGAALVVIDRTAFGLSVWDIPRGPILAMSDERVAMSLIESIKEDAKLDKCMSLYLSPLKTQSLKLKASSRHEQPEATRIIDLTQSEDGLLKQMHQKGRYNIKVATKNDVTVTQSDDINAYYELARSTSSRDAFGIPSKKQLQTFLSHLDGSFLLLAYADNKPIAGLLGVIYKGVGIYYYGASDYEHRSLMAPYLLQWEAMQVCKKAGCTQYDLLGIAPPHAGKDHPWQGISGFKEKFGGSVVTYPVEQEILIRPMAKKIIDLKRKIFG